MKAYIALDQVTLEQNNKEYSEDTKRIYAFLNGEAPRGSSSFSMPEARFQVRIFAPEGTDYVSLNNLVAALEAAMRLAVSSSAEVVA